MPLRSPLARTTESGNKLPHSKCKESGNKLPHSKFAALLPLAVLPGGIGMEVVASALIGAAIAVLVWWVFRVLESDDLEQGSRMAL